MLVDRLVIERTYRYDELGDPIVDFESKDYAECVIEELEKIKAEIIRNSRPQWEKLVIDVYTCETIIDKSISDLKGENK